MPIVWVFVAGEMWNRLCERRNKVKDTLKRLSLYGFTMLLLPCLVYFTIFHFHLSMVPNAGDHDLLVSPKLKYSLVGHQAEPSQPSKDKDLHTLLINKQCLILLFFFFFLER